MRRPKKGAPFQVGDLVVTEFEPGAEDVVRVVMAIKKGNSQSGWLIKTDGGPICPTCKRPEAKPISGIGSEGVDSDWFHRVQQ